jgi:hypothetical protein
MTGAVLDQPTVQCIQDALSKPLAGAGRAEAGAAAWVPSKSLALFVLDIDLLPLTFAKILLGLPLLFNTQGRPEAVAGAHGPELWDLDWQPLELVVSALGTPSAGGAGGAAAAAAPPPARRADMSADPMCKAFLFSQAARELLDRQSRRSARPPRAEELKARMGKAVDAAREEQKKAQKEAATLRVAHNKPAVTVPTDIVNVPQSDPEYQQIAAHAAACPHAIQRILKVTSRRSVYDAYKKQLAQQPLQPGEAVQEQHSLFHGTVPSASARSIARTGPNLALVGKNGTALGAGFYTTKDFSYALGYATNGGSGSVCVGFGASVRLHQGGDSSLTAAQLAAMTPPQTAVNNGPVYVWFHPDAFLVTHIIDFDPAVRAVERHCEGTREASYFRNKSDSQKAGETCARVHI